MSRNGETASNPSTVFTVSHTNANDIAFLNRQLKQNSQHLDKKGKCTPKVTEGISVLNSQAISGTEPQRYEKAARRSANEESGSQIWAKPEYLRDLRNGPTDKITKMEAPALQPVTVCNKM